MCLQICETRMNLNFQGVLVASLNMFYTDIRKITDARCIKKRVYPGRPQWWTGEMDHLALAKQSYMQAINKAKYNAWRIFAEESLQKAYKGTVYKLAR